ncbi:hypothetical protein HY025_05975 [Candidatus Daviesbacteria bacterium]|nr:hypothetical protein [Candidatus Daviesbacteria bacterium]
MSKLLLPIVLIIVLVLAVYFLVIKQNQSSYSPTTNYNPTYNSQSDINNQPSNDPGTELQRLDKLMNQANPDDFNDPDLASGNI